MFASKKTNASSHNSATVKANSNNAKCKPLLDSQNKISTPIWNRAKMTGSHTKISKKAIIILNCKRWRLNSDKSIPNGLKPKIITI